MVPTLKIPTDKLDSNGFINAYIKDEKREVQYDDVLYLLFHPKDIDKFRPFLLDEYDRTNTIIDDYDYEDGFVVVVYKLNPVFKEDFELIKQGKYSKTSVEFQKLFPKSIKIEKDGLYKEQLSIQYRVFNRSEDLLKFWEDKFGMTLDKDQELWYGFIEKNEVLNVEELKKYSEHGKIK
jgi:hypothetical protein